MKVVTKIYDGIVCYHDTKLESTVKLARIDETHRPNITALANGSISDAVKLGVMLVLISMLCDQKEEFMDMFMMLGQHYQTSLVMALNPLLGNKESLKRSISGVEMQEGGSNRELLLEEEISRLLKEKELSDENIRLLEDKNVSGFLIVETGD